MPKKKRRPSTTSAARAARRNAHDFYGMGYVADPVYGPTIPAELLARRRADSVIAAAMRKLRKKARPAKKAGKRRAKKKASPAQLRTRKAFAARAKTRAKSGMAGRMRAGKRYNPKTASKGQKALYARALRAARAVGVGKKRRAACAAPKRKTSRKKVQTVTAAQVIAMAKKKQLHGKLLCFKRTGKGSYKQVR